MAITRGFPDDELVVGRPSGMRTGPANEGAFSGDHAFPASNRLFVKRRRRQIPPDSRGLDAFALEGPGPVGPETHFDAPNMRRSSNMAPNRNRGSRLRTSQQIGACCGKL